MNARLKRPRVFSLDEPEEEINVTETKPTESEKKTEKRLEKRHKTIGSQQEEDDETYVTGFKENTLYGSLLSNERFEEFKREWLGNRSNDFLSKLFRPRTFWHLVGNETVFGKLREVITATKPSSKGKGFVVLTGPYGMGKTSALECIAKDAKRDYLMPTGHHSESKGITKSYYVTLRPLKPNYGREKTDFEESVTYFRDVLIYANLGKYDIYFDQCEAYAHGENDQKRNASKLFFSAFLKAYDGEAERMEKKGIWVVFVFSGDTFRTSLGCRVLETSERCLKLVLKPSETSETRRKWVETYAKPMALTQYRNVFGSKTTYETAYKRCGSEMTDYLLQVTKCSKINEEDDDREQSLASLSTRIDCILNWHPNLTKTERTKTKTDISSKDSSILGVDLYSHLKQLMFKNQEQRTIIEDNNLTTHMEASTLQHKQINIEESNLTMHAETSTLHHISTQLLYARNIDLNNLSEFTDYWSDLDNWTGAYYNEEEGHRYWILNKTRAIAEQTSEKPYEQRSTIKLITPSLFAMSCKEHLEQLRDFEEKRLQQTWTLPSRDYCLYAMSKKIDKLNIK